MKYNGLKNVTICLLVFFAIFQTGRLWFKDNSNRNFFYSFLSDKAQPLAVKQQKAFYEPQRIILNFGTKKFDRYYPSEQTSQLQGYVKDALVDVLSSDSYKSADTLDYELILTSKSVIYEYAVQIEPGDFLSSLNVKSQSFSNRISCFDKIVLQPEKSAANILTVFFVDTLHNSTYKYQITKNKLSENIYNILEGFQVKQGSDWFYTSTKQSGIQLFNDNVFLPQWSTVSASASSVFADNPYAQGNDINTILLESYADNFFDNPASKWSGKDLNGVYTFSDRTTVIKYYPTGVFEYFDYSAVKNTLTSVNMAYETASLFLERDRELKSDFTLSQVQENDEGFVFYFDYTINELPVFLTEELINEIGMNSAIEVVVSNETVKKYKRFAATLYVDSSTREVVNVDFVTALNKIVVVEENGLNVENMFIGYELSRFGSLDFLWKIKLNGEWYSEKAAVNPVVKD